VKVIYAGVEVSRKEGKKKLTKELKVKKHEDDREWRKLNLAMVI